MGRKSYRISCEIRLRMVCVPNSRLCKFDHIYVNVEVFGETQKSDLMHPCFPISTDELFHFEKVLWSPQTKTEALNLLKESPVSIELRQLKDKCSESMLMAFADSNAYSFLIEHGRHDKDTVTVVDKSIDLSQTSHHCGPPPKIKFSLVTKITCSSTPIMDGLVQYYSDPCIYCELLNSKSGENFRGGCYITPCGDVYSCDCELHKDDRDETHHCKACHQDRILNICVNCLSKLNKKREESKDREVKEDEKTARTDEKFRPLFVVRKVPRDLVARNPDAYDSQYNHIIRKQAQPKSDKEQRVRRLRSCSPKKENPGQHSSTAHGESRPVCYGCLIPPEPSRISCDACNLTSRGELSNRNCKVVRPEPPLLRTYREVVDQRPIATSGVHKCPLCVNRTRPGQHKDGHTDSLFSSSRPLYLLDGYRDMAKYFSEPGRH